LLSHKNKYNRATKEFSDIKLIYKEEYPTRMLAEKREKQFKGWTVAKKKALIVGNLELLRQLSKTHKRVDGNL
jgi:predicted GIY-YIG superfamily endonuclease